MPRSVVIAITVLGVAALLLSTTFALVRSAQLANSRAQIAALRSELAEARDGSSDGGGDADATEPANPLDDLLEGGGLDDLFSEDGRLEDLLGGDVEQLARCIRQAGPPGSSDVPDGDAAEQIAQISDAVQRLRSLSFEEDPSPDFLDDARIAERLTAEVREDYDEGDAEADQRILPALGAVPPGLDLIEVLTALLTSQVAGFYDPDTGELVVRGDASDNGLDPAAQSTLAHELEHALADQAFDLPVDVTEDVTDSDAALAALSVVEGDATLTQQQFTVVGMTVAEQLGLNTDPSALAAQRELADVPTIWPRACSSPTSPASGSPAHSTSRAAGRRSMRSTTHCPRPARRSSTRSVTVPWRSTHVIPGGWAVTGSGGARPRWVPPNCCGSSRPPGVTRRRRSTSHASGRWPGPAASSPCGSTARPRRSAWR